MTLVLSILSQRWKNLKSQFCNYTMTLHKSALHLVILNSLPDMYLQYALKHLLIA